MSEYNFSYNLSKQDFVNAMLFITYGSNSTLKKSQIRLTIIGVIGVLFGISRLVLNNMSADIFIGVFMLIMGVYLLIYGLFRVKSMREKMMAKSIEKFHMALFEGENHTTITQDLVTEKSAHSYQELKKEIFRIVYELKDSFVFLTSHGSICVIPVTAIDNLEAFRNDIKIWYDYENHYHWKW